MAEAANQGNSRISNSPDFERLSPDEAESVDPPDDSAVALDEDTNKWARFPSDAAGVVSALKAITIPIWIGIAVLLMAIIIVIARCAGGDDSGRVYLAVADDRGNVHITPATPTELDSEQRIGRLSDLDGQDSPLILIYKKNDSGVPELIHEASLVMTSSGQRLSAFSTRRSATTIERGPIKAPLGEGIELATGEVAEVLYYIDDDIVYFEEHSGNNRACYVSESGAEPTRIAIGNSCDVLLAVDLVEVRTDRRIAYYNYDGDEQLELDTARFSNVDVVITDNGESLVATLQSESGLTELIIGQFDGEQQFITANDNVRLRAYSPRVDWFMYSDSAFGEADRLYLANSNDEIYVGEGDIDIASISPDGSRAVAGIIAEGGRFEIWEADLETDAVAFDLIHDLYFNDLAGIQAVWLDASPAQLLLAVTSFDELDSFVELRTAEDSTELTASSAEVGGYGIVPLGSSWLWLSTQNPDTGDSYTIVELIRSKVVASDDLDGIIRSLVILDDNTVAITLNRAGSIFLTYITIDHEDFEITDLTASDWIGDLFAGGGQLYARSQSGSGFVEILTAAPRDDDVDSLSGDITQVVSLLDQRLNKYSSSR